MRLGIGVRRSIVLHCGCFLELPLGSGILIRPPWRLGHTLLLRGDDRRVLRLAAAGLRRGQSSLLLVQKGALHLRLFRKRVSPWTRTN